MGTPIFGNVTALFDWICIEEIQDQKRAAHMLEACGLGFSQVMSPSSRHAAWDLHLRHGADDREELYDGVPHRARDRLRLLELLGLRAYSLGLRALGLGRRDYGL